MGSNEANGEPAFIVSVSPLLRLASKAVQKLGVPYLLESQETKSPESLTRRGSLQIQADRMLNGYVSYFDGDVRKVHGDGRCKA